MIRLAILDDLDMLFKWRNDPEFVALSEKHETVTQADHRLWFARHAGRIWIILHNGHACGVIWVSYDNHLAISIEPEYRRTGLGTEAIMTVCDTLKQPIKALIQSDNLASRMALSKAGFRVTQMEWRP